MIEHASCIKCGNTTWRMTQTSRGWQTYNRCSIHINDGYYIELDDYESSDFDADETDDTTYICDNCDYELDTDDYIGQAIEIAVRPALIRPKARTHSLVTHG